MRQTTIDAMHVKPMRSTLLPSGEISACWVATRRQPLKFLLLKCHDNRFLRLPLRNGLPAS